ncbi:hypothetical protein [Actinomadura bangladeshensis]|uniref:Uncharacterized protein n=1 Tax=Actinomadura bangladeshensis TaxID=453573 RepID=A0A4R4NBI8_9ACTN|nr:hypothetical protein [Actinomadura bangladeshensis]TDC04700.1 hypothetical protein E1284_36490 [Actinomadura bangladeshensis]
MGNLPNPRALAVPDGQVQDGVTLERFRVLVRLMWALREVGQGSVLYLDAAAEPVLSVPLVARRRSLAVLGVQERDGRWAYLWDAACKVPAESVRLAARRIAGVSS